VNLKTIVNSILFIIVAIAIVAWQYSNEANTAAEISTIISAGVDDIEICSINGKHIVDDCTTYSSKQVLRKFEIALKGGHSVSGQEYLDTALENALKVSSGGIDYWYIAIEYDGLPDKLYLVKIELVPPSNFRHTPNRYILPDSYRYIFN